MLITYYNDFNCIDYVNNARSYDFKQLGGSWE